MEKLKKVNKLLLSISIIISGFGIVIPKVNAKSFSSGTGTINDPYIIKTLAELKNVGNYCGEKYFNTYFKMDIDNNVLDMGNSTIEPICNLIDKESENKALENAFYGHFDGNNTEIINAKIKSNGISGGLFGASKGAEIINIGLGSSTSVSTYGKSSITNNSPTGGIVGYAVNTTLNNVWNKANITASYSISGGIAGFIRNTKIINAYNFGSIYSGKDNNNEGFAGGIVGVSNASSIENVVNYNINISNEGTAGKTGLLVGYFAGNESNIKNAYTLKVNTSLNGWGAIQNDKINSENVKGYTEEELKNKDNYIGFDFDNVWQMSNEYAILKNSKSDQEISSINTSEQSTIERPKRNLVIKYDSRIVDIDNFLYEDGRTFVDLYKFCSTTKICSVSYDKDNEEYIITKNLEATGEKVTSKLDSNNTNYEYKVIHKKGTKLFKPYIVIGGRKIENDVAKQESDVSSCPDDNDHKCDDKTFYVPVRFLSQSLGLRVEWDGENGIVNIKDTFADSFNQKYDIITSTKENCSQSSCSVEEQNNDDLYIKLNKETKYYMSVIDKETNEVKDFYKLYSFYTDNVERSGSKNNLTFKKGIFSINKNTITIEDEKSDIIASNVAQIIVYEIKDTDKDYKKENFNVGGYPIVINKIFICDDCNN